MCKFARQLLSNERKECLKMILFILTTSVAKSSNSFCVSFIWYKYNYFRLALHFVNRILFLCVKSFICLTKFKLLLFAYDFLTGVASGRCTSCKLCQTANAIKARRLYILTECLYYNLLWKSVMEARAVEGKPRTLI